MSSYLMLEDALRQDPGARGLAAHLKPGDLQAATESLISSRHVAIATGFYIPRAGNIESDGPPGATYLARSLETLGKQVTLLCPESGRRAMERCLDEVGLTAGLILLTPGEVSPQLLDELDADVFVGLEYAGQGHDGRSRNMRGIDISEHVPFLDGVLMEARARGVITVAIGDGGNELGCGEAGALVAACREHGSNSRSTADYVLCTGISNWGAYVLVAALSLASGEMLLPGLSEELRLLEALCDVGVVDGVTGICEPTVDGMPYEANAQFLSELRQLTSDLLQKRVSRD